MTTKKTDSPYLFPPNRLADVIAAIQAMATYKFYKLPFDGWADRISGDPSKGGSWKKVFEEHPEFFRLDSQREKASLVWRRQYPKLFHVDREQRLSPEEYSTLNPEEKLRVSRNALSASDIKTLVDTAVNLHSRALEEKKDSRWWLALVSAGGALVGSLLGAALKSCG